MVFIDVQETITEALSQLEEQKEVYLELPHSYLFGVADAIYSAPSQHSQLLFESDLVPFYEIVLSGSVKLFSTPLNFGSQERQDILRLIDFNLYPSFMATAEESAELNNSNTQDIYYSEFGALSEDIKAIYEEVSAILTPVMGAEVLSREIPANNISVTEYSNGQTIVVNYSSRPYDYEGVEVAAQSAVVRGSDSFD